jgi:citrate synthase
MRYLSAKAAAEELGVTLQTLYAYVSRGLLRSEPEPGQTRRRRYSASDVQELKRRQERKRDPAGAIENAMHWGSPVMESGITLISDGRLYYRGKDAVELSRRGSLEQVAALIWQADGDSIVCKPQDVDALPWEILRALPPTDAFQVAAPIASTSDLAVYSPDPQVASETGARIVGLFAAIVAGSAETMGSVAETLREGWGVPGDPEPARGLLNATLILCADHELNASAFTARTVASTGSTLYAAVNAGLSALQGHKHGGSTDRVEALFSEVELRGDATQVLANYMRRGDIVPGFGHNLYPDGDPRAAELLARTRESYGDAMRLTPADDLARATEGGLGQRPNIDFALVAVRRALQLPVGSALTLFALGRTVGWIGHAIEQYATDRLIRPRARYVGITPEQTGDDM